VVTDPLATRLAPGPIVPAPEAARALAASLRRPHADDPAPAWLLPPQQASFSRAVAALRRFGCTLVADPVGSGKTYVALAIARLWNGDRPTLCLVPAALSAQWIRTASALGIPVIVHSHERLSRGRLPPAAAGLVIIDESHHYRNPVTRRYHHLCRWLRDQRLLLLSATPVVNRAEDLANQLLLGVRDDALRPYGLPSLLNGLGRPGADAVLGRIVISAAAGHEGRPTRIDRVIPISEPPPRAIIEGIDRLRLSPSSGVASLIGGVLWSAIASSPGACVEALRRYRRLLLQAQDGKACGRALTRAAIRRFTAGQENQLVFWQLLTDDDASENPRSGGLALEDIARLDPIIEAAERWASSADTKCRALAELLADDRRTVVFTDAIATVQFLREHLGGRSLAWCFGRRAGIGTTVVPRQSVLRWFRPPLRCDAGVPKHLVTTDVTAEGLDLQAAERIVHYDLPWTPMRMEQRDGRALRLGGTHQKIEVIRFDPPEVVERRLHRLAQLDRKARLPPEMGLSRRSSRGWGRWDDVFTTVGAGPSRPGVAVVEAQAAGALAGFVMQPCGIRKPSLEVPVVGWLAADGTWSEEPDRIEPALRAAARAPDRIVGPHPGELSAILSAVRSVIRTRLDEMRRRHWTSGTATAESRKLIRRLRSLSRAAIRRRDAALLHLLDRAIRHVGGSHSAAEAARIAGLSSATSDELKDALSDFPLPSPALDAVEVRLGPVIIFRSASA
jgi:superfamily II DNA or RNA helicase